MGQARADESFSAKFWPSPRTSPLFPSRYREIPNSPPQAATRAAPNIATLTALSGRPLHRAVVLKPSRRPTLPVPHELEPSPPPSCAIPTSSPRTPASSSSWAQGRSRRRPGSTCAGSSCRSWRSTAPCHLASPLPPPRRPASPLVPPHRPAPRRRHLLPAAAAGDFPRSEHISTGGLFLLQKAKRLTFIFKRPYPFDLQRHSGEHLKHCPANEGWIQY